MVVCTYAIYSVARLLFLLSYIIYNGIMAFGQIHYDNIIQGIPQGKYTIAQIGCFLTAFSNLLARFGIPYTPPRLNRLFIDKRAYIDADDGIRDDLTYNSISKIFPSVVVLRSGSSAVPPSADAIVKMSARNTFGTHFSLVHSIRGKQVFIVDSWDGKVKPSSAYGPIKGWATYKLKEKKQSVAGIKKRYISHTIVDGDTLWQLENRYGKPRGSLAKLNPGIDVLKLKVGSKIRLS